MLCRYHQEYNDVLLISLIKISVELPPASDPTVDSSPDDSSVFELETPKDSVEDDSSEEGSGSENDDQVTCKLLAIR